jgi:hypothetical protein
MHPATGRRRLPRLPLFLAIPYEHLLVLYDFFMQNAVPQFLLAFSSFVYPFYNSFR